MNFNMFISIAVALALCVDIWLLIGSLSSIEIKFVTTARDVKIPCKRKEDAGYDIYPYFKEDYIMIKPHETATIPTGLKSVIPKGFYIQLKERGSTGTKTVIQQCGVIDSGFRGEWFVPITNGSNKYMFIAKDNDFIKKKFGADTIILPYDKAICQATIEVLVNSKIKRLKTSEFEKYTNTERGVGMLGSSGK